MNYPIEPPERHDLPSRRLTETLKVETKEGHMVLLSVGFDPDDDEVRPREVFYSDGFRSGADLEYQTQDACVLISLLLQHGFRPDDIRKSLAREEQPNGSMIYASLIGLICDELCKYGGDA